MARNSLDMRLSSGSVPVASDQQLGPWRAGPPPGQNDVTARGFLNLPSSFRCSRPGIETRNTLTAAVTAPSAPPMDTGIRKAHLASNKPRSGTKGPSRSLFEFILEIASEMRVTFLAWQAGADLGDH